MNIKQKRIFHHLNDQFFQKNIPPPHQTQYIFQYVFLSTMGSTIFSSNNIGIINICIETLDFHYFVIFCKWI